MMLHIALVAEILATIICIHCIYGRKVELDVKTVGTVLGILTILEIINFFKLSAIFSLIVYIILFVYCKLKFKSSYTETVISIIMCIIISTFMQFISISVISLVSIEKEYVRNAISNVLTLGVFITLLPLCKLHRVRTSLCRNRKFVLIISGFICFVAGIILIQGKMFQAIRVHEFILVLPAIMMLLYSVWKWYTAQSEAERMEEEIRKVEFNSEEYESLLTKVRLRQHEFKNHMAAILSAHYTHKTYEKLVQAQEAYCEQLLDENKYNNLLLLGNKVLVGYLHGKFQEGEEDGIEINYKVATNIDRMQVSTYYIIEMLGILFDNAVEALKESTEKSIFIEIYEDREKYIFSIRNPFRYVSYDEISEWFEYEKSIKGCGRGLGLYHLKCLCEQWKCEIECRNLEIDQKNWIVFTLKVGKGL